MSGSEILFSGAMLQSPNYVASVEAGELVPMIALSTFRTEEEDWTWWQTADTPQDKPYPLSSQTVSGSPMALLYGRIVHTELTAVVQLILFIIHTSDMWVYKHVAYAKNPRDKTNI